jgi:hypothetical protein
MKPFHLCSVLFCCWLATRVIILLFTPQQEQFSLSLYYGYAQRCALGETPYKDFYFEYPPGSLLFLLPPRIFGKTEASYSKFFIGEALLFDLLLLGLIAGGTRRLAGAGSVEGMMQGRWKSTALYIGSSFLLGPLLYRRFDLFPTVLSVLAFGLLPRLPGVAWITLGLASAVKIYPVFLAPILLVQEMRSGLTFEFRSLLRRILFFLGGILLGIVPLFLVFGRPPLKALLVQTRRGLQVETLFATPFLLARAFGAKVDIAYRFGAFDVEHAATHFLARLSLPLLVIAVGVFSLWYLPDDRRQTARAGGLERASLDVIAMLGLVLLFSKVLSPQFFIWLLPWVALAGGSSSARTLWLALLFLPALFLTTWIYPYHYWDIIGATTRSAALVLAARNGLLVALTAIAIHFRGQGQSSTAEGSQDSLAARALKARMRRERRL